MIPRISELQKIETKPSK